MRGVVASQQHRIRLNGVVARSHATQPRDSIVELPRESSQRSLGHNGGGEERDCSQSTANAVKRRSRNTLSLLHSLLPVISPPATLYPSRHPRHPSMLTHLPSRSGTLAPMAGHRSQENSEIRSGSTVVSPKKNVCSTETASPE